MTAQPLGFMTQELARQIEQECSLPLGMISFDRPYTEAERLFLSIPERPGLAFHVDRLAGKTTLVVFEQDLGDPKAKAYLQGTPIGTPEDEMIMNENLWAALVVVRGGGLRDVLGEDMAVTCTGWAPGPPGSRFSWSFPPGSVRGIFSDSPRPLLVSPTIGPVPGPGDDDEGPKEPQYCIAGLNVDAVAVCHSVVFQGVSSLMQKDPLGIVQAAAKFVDRGLATTR